MYVVIFSLFVHCLGLLVGGITWAGYRAAEREEREHRRERPPLTLGDGYRYLPSERTDASLPAPTAIPGGGARRWGSST
jgi:hypothetical protein